VAIFSPQNNNSPLVLLPLLLLLFYNTQTMGVHVLYTSFKNIFHTTFCNQKKCSPYNYEKWWSIILPISTKCPTRSHLKPLNTIMTSTTSHLKPLNTLMTSTTSHLKPLNTIMTLTYTCHENNACCAQLNNLSSPWANHFQFIQKVMDH
jgi:hypothetical protein